jgi:Sulfate permease family
MGACTRRIAAGSSGTTIGSVPDGMASAVLTGVNPVYGLYASFAGPIGGGLTASTELMVITTTAAASLCDCIERPPARWAGRPFAGISGYDRLPAGIPGCFACGDLCGMRGKSAVERQ